jgi:predicted Zn-dependent peptidase
MVGVAAGSLPGKADDLLRVVRAELARVVETGLTEEEVERGKGQARGGTVLALEDSGSRMTRLGEAELFQKELLPVDEVLSRLEAVTPRDVHDLARRLFSTPETLAAVGPAR